VLSWWANSQGRNALTRCGWSFRHNRAPQSLRLCVSAPLRLCGDHSFATFAPSRETCSELEAFGVNGARPESKSKMHKGNAHRKTTSGISHGLVQSRGCGTPHAAPIHHGNPRLPRVLRSKLCLEVSRPVQSHLNHTRTPDRDEAATHATAPLSRPTAKCLW
jgi:hypothetical protein